MNRSQFEEFCGGPFWVSSSLVNNSWPEFTPCFVTTVLVWIPCGYVWILLPYFLYAVRDKGPSGGTSRSSTKGHASTEGRNPTESKFSTDCGRQPADAQQGGKFTAVCAWKIVLACLLAVMALAQLIIDVRDHQPVATMVSSAVYAVTYVLVAFQLWYERRKGHIAMFIAFYFFVLNIIFGIVPLYSWIITEGYQSHQDSFSLLVANLVVNFMCLTLACVSDAASGSRKEYQQMDWKCSPETSASYPSKLFFAWLSKLIYTAVRREITSEDVFDLSLRDQSYGLNVEFGHRWKKEISRVNTINASRSANGAARPSSNNPTQNGKAISTDDVREGTRPNEITPHLGPDNMVHEKTSLLARGRYKLFGDWAPRPTRQSKRPNLFRVLFLWQWKRVVAFLIQKIACDVIFLSTPMILGAIMDKLEQSDEKTTWQIYVLCFLLALAVCARSMLYSHSRYGNVVLALHLKTVLATAIFKKTLAMSNQARKGYTAGDIVNLMSLDCQRLQDFLTESSFILTSPLQILIAVVLLFVSMGPSMLASIVVLVLGVAFSSWIVGRQKPIHEAILKLKDQRMRIVSEALNGMKVLKLYAWEGNFQEKVEKIRANEIKELGKLASLYAASDIGIAMTPFLCSLATFATYVLIDRNNVLDPKTAFVSLLLFTLLRLPVLSLNFLINYIVQITVSMKRINDFLVSEDLDLSGPRVLPEAGQAISIKEGVFTWDTTLPPTLLNININIACAQLTAIVGMVSSGKSSLISAILGEMLKIQGQVAIKGRIALVSQQAWIQNATLRDNILFGKEYNKQRYNQVIKACELERDLEILEAGDQTEIGEKGINLSGGQKQRVNLARAVYSDSDIYLFDDPLSAVDAHVGRAIFKNVVGVKGMLADKTRVLVTHGIHWLSQVDYILVLTNGTISEQGSYHELVTHNGPFAKLLQVYLTSNQVDESPSDDDDEEVEQSMVDLPSCTIDNKAFKYDNVAKSNKSQKELQNMESNYVSHSRDPLDASLTVGTSELEGRLTVDEEIKTGRVTSDVFLTFGRNFGFCSMALALTFFTLSKGCSLSSIFFLAEWTNDELLLNSSTRVTQEGSQRLTYYLAVYGAGFGLFQLLTLAVYDSIFWKRMVYSALRLHQLLIDRLVRAPMSFFDQTPTGQILNRVSKDVDTVDITIPICINDSLMMISFVAAIFISILAQAPVMTPVLIVVCIVCYFLQQYSLRTTRQLKRMESISRSPVFTYASEFFSGAAIIRAYGAAERFIEEFEQRVDYNQKYFYVNQIIDSWLPLAIGILSGCLVLINCVVLVAGGANSSDMAISAYYAIQVTLTLSYLVKQVNEFQTSIVAVERIQAYSQIEQEAILINPDNRPSPSWPARGEVVFTEYQTCYRKGLDLVLKGINCHIHGGEKVGIIGRTGAGKSSLALSMFRIIEAVGGSITVDGISLVDIGLHDLRSKLTILPQDSFIFSGSLRSNIDPFELYTDGELWAAIERSHLKPFVCAQPERLDFECGHDGSNLSVGQRQLVCLARSLLRHTKILILDEATAAVDVETDALIQKTIKEEFSECTIIAIAHRLSTIMDYDRIIVMDAGIISEFDSPRNLISSRGMFYGMCKDAGLV